MSSRKIYDAIRDANGKPYDVMMIDEPAYNKSFEQAWRQMALGYSVPQIKVVEAYFLRDDDVISMNRTLYVRSIKYFFIQHFGYKHAFNHYKLSDEIVSEAIRFAQNKLASYIDKL